MKTVSNATEAWQIFRDFIKNSGAQATNIGKSKAKYFSVQQINDWYNRSYGEPLNTKWFGRSLKAAMDTGKNLSIDKSTGSTLYRNSK